MSMKRRSFLGVVAGGIAGLAGCSEQQARAKFVASDEFPESDKVNRKCEIQPTRETGGSIQPTLGGGWRPFVFAYEGREDMRGYNQTFEVTMEAEYPVNVFTVYQEDRDQLVDYELREYALNTLENSTQEGGNTSLSSGENGSEMLNGSSGNNTGTTNQTSGGSEPVSRPDSATLIETNTTETSFTTHVANENEKNMVFTPATEETGSELPVNVSLNMSCRYYLPYETYKDAVENSSN